MKKSLIMASTLIILACYSCATVPIQYSAYDSSFDRITAKSSIDVDIRSKRYLGSSENLNLSYH